MKPAAYVSIVVALVALIRRWRPSIDGPLVLLLALAASAAVVFGLDGFTSLPEFARATLGVALQAVGWVTLTDRAATKLGAGLGPALGSPAAAVASLIDPAAASPSAPPVALDGAAEPAPAVAASSVRARD
jgi:hypothetical protein